MAAFFRCQVAVRLKIGQQGLRAADSVKCVAAVAVEHFRLIGRCDIDVRCRHYWRLCNHVRHGINMLLIILAEVCHGVAGTGNVVTGRVHIHHKTGWRHANQHQHDQTDTLLTIVSAVRETHADSRQNQTCTCPEWRLFLAVFLLTFRRCQVDTGMFLIATPVTAQQENHGTGDNHPDQRRDNQRSKNTNHFRDV